MILNKLNSFFGSEPAAGIILMLASFIGLIAANSPMAGNYFSFLSYPLIGLSVLHWVNDALMAVFFLYVGLEVKREFLEGNLSSNKQRLLPGLAALAGLALPAVLFLSLNYNNIDFSRGWAIPTATDIAFALGVVALLGNRVPIQMKVFLTALAIMDDLAAIIIIAIFYTAQLNWYYLGGATVTLIALWLLNKSKVTAYPIYIIMGVLLWFMVLKSGIHATLAGVALALAIPLRDSKLNQKGEAPLIAWEHRLAKWVAFLVIPLFGFANAGVSFEHFSIEQLSHPVVMGIALGLFVGKQLGIFSLVYVGDRLGWLEKPDGANWWHVYGIALLCGIGFTMSLFISLLAYEEAYLQDLSKIGVFLGSILSGLSGYIILRLQKPHTLR